MDAYMNETYEVVQMDYITTEQAAENAKGLTFENVWAALMETRQRMDESHHRTEKAISDLTKNIGGLGNRLGELVEIMFTSELWKTFNGLGYEFNSQSQRRKFIDGDSVIAEADVFLENNEFAMPVEIKVTLSADNVDEHIEQIERIRSYMDSHGDTRKLLGAVAGGIVPENVSSYAHSKGLFVIVQNGESVLVAAMPQDFVAMQW